MKYKKLLLIVFLLVIILTTGCLKRDKMENISIITTAYPIEYIIKQLYGDSSTINSIYPKGVNISDYTLTEKQLKDFSSNDLLIYNGTGVEKNYAIKFLGYNRNMKIIDASYGINYTNSVSELWLNPANMLMMEENIKTELQAYISNPYIIEEINNKHNEFKVSISELDSQFKKIAINSKEKRIITSDETFKFIEKYGFTVINLTNDGKIVDKNLNTANNLLKDKTIKYVFILDNENVSDEIENLISTNNASKIVLKTLNNINDLDIENNTDYLSIMYDNINNFTSATY